MKLVVRRPHKPAKQVPHYQSIQSIFDSSSSEASLISSCVQELWLAWACHASPQGSTVAWCPTFPRLLQRKLWGQALHLRQMIKELLSECIVSGQTTKAAWSKRSSTALAIALSNLFIAKQEEIQLINGKNWVVKAAKTSGGRIYCEASLLAGISCLIKMALVIDNIDTPQDSGENKRHCALCPFHLSSIAHWTSRGGQRQQSRPSFYFMFASSRCCSRCRISEHYFPGDLELRGVLDYCKRCKRS